VRLAEAFADEVTGRYRIERAAAVELILSRWSRRPDLLAAAARARSPEEIRRLRVYRDAASDAKREVYHRLRRYRRAPEDADAALAALCALDADAPPETRTERARAVALAHASVAERAGGLDAFCAALTACMGSPATVVDVGCGVLPLVFRLGASVRQWWALDRDPRAIAALEALADDRLRPVRWDLAEGWSRAGLPRRCDVGLLLKIVPVVARTDPALLTTLAATPADRLVVSGCRAALTRREDIERRETAVLLRFFAVYGLRVVDRFRTADETCFVVERRS